MRVEKPHVGQVVRSRAGRDRGRLLIITGIADENHVYVVDGELRMLEQPKKKKLRHLDATRFEADVALVEKLTTGAPLQNAQLRKHLAEITQVTQGAVQTDEKNAGKAASAAVSKGRPQGRED